jgi:hypothetical protein
MTVVDPTRLTGFGAEVLTALGVLAGAPGKG